MNSFLRFCYTLVIIITAMIANDKYADVLWAIICGIFAPITWGYWLITKDINITEITNTFDFFFK